MNNHHRIAIRTRNLSKVLGGRPVLRGIALDIVEGQRVAFLGPNGAGKTTLLRCLAGSLRPSGGLVEWFGASPRANPAARRLVGLVGHESHLYPHLTLRENLVFAARMCDVRDPAGRACQLIEEIGLRSSRDHLPGRVSRGMRQRVAIARAIVHDPPILLLDEPFAGLDEPGARWLFRLLVGSTNQARTVCFATHDRTRAERLADRLIELRTGQACEITPGDAASSSASSAARPLAARAA